MDKGDSLYIEIDGKDFVELLRKISLEFKIKSYIVGGFIRDYLLGVKNFDIDVVVEGDGVEFANLLSRYLEGDIVIHEAFRTVTLTYKNISIDVISARKEYYDYPAVLPRIEFSNIYDDLARRDFTINTLAYDVVENKFIDYFNGIQDLKTGVIRILHSKSFIDDPTRIFRAIRYSVRYSFAIESETERLLKESIDKIRLLTPDRIRNELFLILKEDKAKEMIEKVIYYGIDKIVFGDVSINTKNLDYFENSDIDIVLYRFLILFYLIKEKDLIKIKESLNISSLYLKSLEDLIFLCKQLKCKDKNVRKIRLTLQTTKKEVIKAISTMENGEAQRIVNTKLYITGEDIKNLGLKPSPLYGELMDKLFEAKMKGLLNNKEEEIEFAKKLIEQLKKGE
ncbi:CCA tRNA nucleotidyltransferase [Thermoanaerobacter kivui]|uniref:CCA tRNA nucleotidyltransferase n=1 Tax=Thermoanaerobacter kivui TaxID=2325 RepID=UPI001F17F9CA|nr:CCA tRNA nucleotidyltransferase [Thermoanaerobacter kivui]